MYKKYYFNFERWDKEVLITNDFGYNMFLYSKNFDDFVKGKNLPKKVINELELKKFIYFDTDEDFVKFNSWQLRDYKSYLQELTVLHIFVVSKNCNYNCVYCQAGRLNDDRDFLMDIETAKKAVDIAMQCPSKNITFEFQGGEPLTNFDIIKFIIEYSKSVNEKISERKEISYNIVSNLSLMTDEIAEYISKNDIYVCTSIDGDKVLQNKNRPCSKADSYDATIGGLKKLQDLHVNVSALLTTTKYSFGEFKNIVDEYISLGLDRICVRPLTNIGKAHDNWSNIGYLAEEFLDFYKKTLDYIIGVNKNGYHLVEGMAGIFLSRILNNESVNYMELRSPCGAAIGQLAYYYDGNVFTCDEGRMLFEMGDDKFLLGNVNEASFNEIINCDKTMEVNKASCLECSHVCHSCVYMPYCGTCPVINYSQTGHLEPYSKNEYRCKINKGILEILFTYIRNDKAALKVFESWI